MTKKTIDFDINEVFNETKKNLKVSMISATAKIELLDDLAKYFKDNGLHVIKDEVEVAEVDTPTSNN